MIVLGIESSCDDTGAAVVKDGKELSNIVASQDDVHAPFGGIVPELAARNHVLHILPVIEKALRDADLTLDDIDGIAATRGPGLVGSLLVGLWIMFSASYPECLPASLFMDQTARASVVAMRDVSASTAARTVRKAW